MDRPDRPLDFTLLLELGRDFDPAELRRAAQLCRQRYPVAGRIVRDGRWSEGGDSSGSFRIEAADSCGNSKNALREFVDRPLQPEATPPLRQVLVGGWLATRLHHCAGDLLSAFFWVADQLRLAGGQAQLPGGPWSQPPPLRSHSSPRLRSPFSHRRPCQPIWHRRGRRSRFRRWLSERVPSHTLQTCCRHRSYSYNDVLLAVTLESLQRWDLQHGAERRLGLWVPIDIRRKPLSGFGNGASRVKIYPAPPETTPANACRLMRRQLDWCLEHGQWAVPAGPPLADLPGPAGRALLRAYLNRPWVDVGSTVFSHVERLRPDDAEALGRVGRIEVVGPLHRRYPVAFNVVTVAGTSHVTLTYDPGLFGDQDAADLAGLWTGTRLQYQEALV